MLLTGSTAVILPLRNLWMHDNSLGQSLDILSDPECALLGWIASGTGWLICELIQVSARFALATRTRRKIEALTREQIKLLEEWRFD